jgi:PAS domain S-box-containing protein
MIIDGRPPADPGDERFRALARAANEAVLIHERGVIREINEAFTRLLGYERDEVVDRSGLEVFISPESHEAVRASMRNPGAGGTSEVTLITKTGERRVVRSTSEPISYLGRPMRVVTMQDLTDRIALERENRQIATLLHAIIENTDQLVLVKDLQGRIQLANRAWREQMGTTDPIGLPDAMVLPRNVLDEVAEVDRRTVETRSAITSELQFPTAHGRRTLLTTKFPLIDDQGQVFAIGDIATDMTERRRATDLIASVSRSILGTVGEAFFEALVRAIAHGLGADYAFVAELTSGGERVRSLAAFAHGAPVVGLIEFAIEGTPSGEVVRNGSLVQTADVDQRFPDDPVLPKLGAQGYLGVPIVGSDLRPRGVLVAIYEHPLTGAERGEALKATLELFASRAAAEMERVQATRLLEDMRAALEQRVAARTAELSASNEELEAFAYSVSHDLRAPLRHISGFAEMLQPLVQGQVPANGRRYLDVIRKSAERMRTLIDDLLSFSRTGRSTLRPHRFAMRELVDQVVRDAAPDARGVEWTIGALPEVDGDRPLLAQVVRNLVDNAIKYSRGRTPPRVWIESQDSESEWIFHVRDNGAGFDPRFADQLFGVFRRLHRDDEFEGNGIGLAMVRRIVHRHGGRTWAQGRPGEGATITFTLPRRNEGRSA